MLDFARLTAPTGDGGVLVAPAPADLAACAARNSAALRAAETPLLGSTLGDWRRRTRQTVCGSDERHVIVIGHQPDFIHAGVWAKHVVARRLADALEGVAINLVVDNDAPRSSNLTVPVVEDAGLRLTSVALADLPPGAAYEQLPPISAERIARFEQEVQDSMKDRFERSLMPLYVRGLTKTSAPRDGIDQILGARRAIDEALGVVVDDRRVSRLWWTPFLADLLQNAERFAESYNRALAGYRTEFHVRGLHRPIPDLQRRADARELPLWAYRCGEARRRLFARRGDHHVTLFADREEIGLFRVDDPDACDALVAPLVGDGAFRIRPRALALTTWARLFLADLFIHGIGGAKYDRISDAVIADYYAITPPKIACVSATLRLDLPHAASTRESVAAIRRTLRDLQWNPQRRLADRPDLAAWLQERETAVRESIRLRAADAKNRRPRRATFEQIRSTNRRLFEAAADVADSRQTDLTRSLSELAQNRIAAGREFFYGLYAPADLGRLLAALPGRSDFRV